MCQSTHANTRPRESLSLAAADTADTIVTIVARAYRARRRPSRSTPTGAARAAVLSAVVLLTACGVAGKKDLIEGAMANGEARRQTFEATARVLDEHPEYVDELYTITREHPRMFGRFVANTARDLREEEFAKQTAEELARNPRALEQIMIRVIDATVRRPAARAAFEKAMLERSRPVNDMVTENPQVFASQLGYTLGNVASRPVARTVFLTTMGSSADALARILADDPDALGRIAAALTRVEVRDPEARKKLLERLVPRR